MMKLKPKLKMKAAKAGQIAPMHAVVERQRKSELQMPRQIAERARNGMR